MSIESEKEKVNCWFKRQFHLDCVECKQIILSEATCLFSNCRIYLEVTNFLFYVFCFLILFFFLFFGREACGILAPWPGIKPAPLALEGKVLTTGPPGKPLCPFLNHFLLLLLVLSYNPHFYVLKFFDYSYLFLTSLNCFLKKLSQFPL